MAIGWLIIATLVIVVLIAIYKSQDAIFIIAVVKKYFFVGLFIGIMLFLVFSLSHIHANYDVDFTSSKGIYKTAGIYFSWLKSLVFNLGRITGYAVNQDWFLNNTNSTSK